MRRSTETIGCEGGRGGLCVVQSGKTQTGGTSHGEGHGKGVEVEVGCTALEGLDRG
jgi:hypothetical protein